MFKRTIGKKFKQKFIEGFYYTFKDLGFDWSFGLHEEKVKEFFLGEKEMFLTKAIIHSENAEIGLLYFDGLEEDGEEIKVIIRTIKSGHAIDEMPCFRRLKKHDFAKLENIKAIKEIEKDNVRA